MVMALESGAAKSSKQVWKEKIARKVKLIQLLKELLDVKDKTTHEHISQELLALRSKTQEANNSLKRELFVACSSTKQIVQQQENSRKTIEELRSTVHDKNGTIAHMEFQSKQLVLDRQQHEATIATLKETIKTLGKKSGQCDCVLKPKKKKLKDKSLEDPPTPASWLSNCPESSKEFQPPNLITDGILTPASSITSSIPQADPSSPGIGWLDLDSRSNSPTASLPEVSDITIDSVPPLLTPIQSAIKKPPIEDYSLPLLLEDSKQLDIPVTEGDAVADIGNSLKPEGSTGDIGSSPVKLLIPANNVVEQLMQMDRLGSNPKTQSTPSISIFDLPVDVSGCEDGCGSIAELEDRKTDLSEESHKQQTSLINDFNLSDSSEMDPELDWPDEALPSEISEQGKLNTHTVNSLLIKETNESEVADRHNLPKSSLPDLNASEVADCQTSPESPIPDLNASEVADCLNLSKSSLPDLNASEVDDCQTLPELPMPDLNASEVVDCLNMSKSSLPDLNASEVADCQTLPELPMPDLDPDLNSTGVGDCHNLAKPSLLNECVLSSLSNDSKSPIGIYSNVESVNCDSENPNNVSKNGLFEKQTTNEENTATDELNEVVINHTTLEDNIMSNMVHAFDNCTKEGVGGIDHSSDQKTSSIESENPPSVQHVDREFLSSTPDLFCGSSSDDSNPVRGSLREATVSPTKPPLLSKSGSCSPKRRTKRERNKSSRPKIDCNVQDSLSLSSLDSRDVEDSESNVRQTRSKSTISKNTTLTRTRKNGKELSHTPSPKVQTRRTRQNSNRDTDFSSPNRRRSSRLTSSTSSTTDLSPKTPTRSPKVRVEPVVRSTRSSTEQEISTLTSAQLEEAVASSTTPPPLKSADLPRSNIKKPRKGGSRCSPRVSPTKASPKQNLTNLSSPPANQFVGSIDSDASFASDLHRNGDSLEPSTSETNKLSTSFLTAPCSSNDRAPSVETTANVDGKDGRVKSLSNVKNQLLLDIQPLERSSSHCRLDSNEGAAPAVEHDIGKLPLAKPDHVPNFDETNIPQPNITLPLRKSSVDEMFIPQTDPSLSWRNPSSDTANRNEIVDAVLTHVPLTLVPSLPSVSERNNILCSSSAPIQCFSSSFSKSTMFGDHHLPTFSDLKPTAPSSSSRPHHLNDDVDDLRIGQLCLSLNLLSMDPPPVNKNDNFFNHFTTFKKEKVTTVGEYSPSFFASHMQSVPVTDSQISPCPDRSTFSKYRDNTPRNKSLNTSSEVTIEIKQEDTPFSLKLSVPAGKPLQPVLFDSLCDMVREVQYQSRGSNSGNGISSTNEFQVGQDNQLLKGVFQKPQQRGGQPFFNSSARSQSNDRHVGNLNHQYKMENKAMPTCKWANEIINEPSFFGSPNLMGNATFGTSSGMTSTCNPPKSHQSNVTLKAPRLVSEVPIVRGDSNKDVSRSMTEVPRPPVPRPEPRYPAILSDQTLPTVQSGQGASDSLGDHVIPSDSIESNSDSVVPSGSIKNNQNFLTVQNSQIAANQSLLLEKTTAMDEIKSRQNDEHHIFKEHTAQTNFTTSPIQTNSSKHQQAATNKTPNKNAITLPLSPFVASKRVDDLPSPLPPSNKSSLYDSPDSPVVSKKRRIMHSPPRDKSKSEKLASEPLTEGKWKNMQPSHENESHLKKVPVVPSTEETPEMNLPPQELCKPKKLPCILEAAEKQDEMNSPSKEKNKSEKLTTIPLTDHQKSEVLRRQSRKRSAVDSPKKSEVGLMNPPTTSRILRSSPDKKRNRVSIEPKKKKIQVNANSTSSKQLSPKKTIAAINRSINQPLKRVDASSQIKDGSKEIAKDEIESCSQCHFKQSFCSCEIERIMGEMILSATPLSPLPDSPVADEIGIPLDDLKIDKIYCPPEDAKESENEVHPVGVIDDEMSESGNQEKNFHPVEELTAEDKTKVDSKNGVTSEINENAPILPKENVKRRLRSSSSKSGVQINEPAVSISVTNRRERSRKHPSETSDAGSCSSEIRIPSGEEERANPKLKEEVVELAGVLEVNHQDQPFAKDRSGDDPSTCHELNEGSRSQMGGLTDYSTEIEKSRLDNSVDKLPEHRIQVSQGTAAANQSVRGNDHGQTSHSTKVSMVPEPGSQLTQSQAIPDLSNHHQQDGIGRSEQTKPSVIGKSRLDNSVDKLLESLLPDRRNQYPRNLATSTDLSYNPQQLGSNVFGQNKPSVVNVTSIPEPETQSCDILPDLPPKDQLIDIGLSKPTEIRNPSIDNPIHELPQSMVPVSRSQFPRGLGALTDLSYKPQQTGGSVQEQCNSSTMEVQQTQGHANPEMDEEPVSGDDSDSEMVVDYYSCSETEEKEEVSAKRKTTAAASEGGSIQPDSDLRSQNELPVQQGNTGDETPEQNCSPSDETIPSQFPPTSETSSLMQLPKFYTAVDEESDDFLSKEAEPNKLIKISSENKIFCKLINEDDVITCSINVLAFASFYDLEEPPVKNPFFRSQKYERFQAKIGNALNEYFTNNNLEYDLKKVTATLSQMAPSHVGKSLCTLIGVKNPKIQPYERRGIAHHFTAVQKKAAVLVVALAKGRFEYFNDVLSEIEEYLIPSPMTLHSLLTNESINLSAVYALICRTQGFGLRAQSFIYDLLYGRHISAFRIIYQILTVIPQAIPRSQDVMGPLSYTIVYLIMKQGIYQNLPPQYLAQCGVTGLRQKLATKYGYSFPADLTRDDVMEELMANVMVRGCDKAIILLSKSQGYKWTYTVAQKHIFPVIDSWIEGKEPDEDLVVHIIKLLGLVSRCFAVSVCEIFVTGSLKRLRLVIQNKPSLPITESVIEALTHFKRLSPEGVINILSHWVPHDNKVTKSMVRTLQNATGNKPYSYWKQYMSLSIY
ncbi:hypothetical protein GE061_013445 [Apolygus lucorum]|uniref:Uncharacterized protein n=1 Tax=Apolygus lucorum TaxID=248454 RepID=A0A6A4K0C5_APOLU|nr:hypothetical protein GE061_013445 [Apolygus lucorum]